MYIDPDGTCPYNGTAADFRNLEAGRLPMNCTCVGTDIKIIVNANSNSLPSSCLLYTSPELKDNTVEFKNKGGEVVFVIPAPFMYDAAGEQSQSVTLALRQGKNKNEYILTVTPDKQWIDRQDRQFPVVIDPVIQTTITYQNGFSSGYVFRCSNGTLGRNTTTQQMYVGEITEGGGSKSKAYIKYTLPTLKEGDKVCEAYMGICQYFNSTPSGGDEMCIRDRKNGAFFCNAAHNKIVGVAGNLA